MNETGRQSNGMGVRRLCGDEGNYKGGISRVQSIAIAVCVVCLSVSSGYGWWGQGGHYRITEGAVSHLPGELGTYFREQLPTLLVYSGREPPGKHYIDIDFYDEFFDRTFPRDRAVLVALYGESTVEQNGEGPWTAAGYIETLSDQMSNATTAEDWQELLLTAGAMAHYIEDLHNPLHLALNYDGQLTGNNGIHARYEGTLIERYFDELIIDPAPNACVYLPWPVDTILNSIDVHYWFVDDIMDADTAYRGDSPYDFDDAYYEGMWHDTGYFTRDLFQKASQLVACAWYTAWIDAGSPVPLRDCNHNGIADAQDILGAFPDCNGNGVPDECDVSLAERLFFDDFPTTTIDPAKWAYVENSTVDTGGIAEPSSPYSLHFDGNPDGGDAMVSIPFDLSAAQSATLSYHWERTGSGDSPDRNRDLRVQFRDSFGDWINLAWYSGDGPDMTTYEQEVIPLPWTALHANFEFVFWNSAAVGNYDDWFVDDFDVTTASFSVDCDANGVPDECQPELTDIAAFAGGLLAANPDPALVCAFDQDGNGLLDGNDIQLFLDAQLFVPQAPRPYVLRSTPRDDFVHRNGCAVDYCDIWFSEDVRSAGGGNLSAADFEVDGSAAGITGFDYDSVEHRVAFYYTSLTDNAWHTIRVSGGVENLLGSKLDGNTDGAAPGSDHHWIDVAVLRGDFQQDGDVDAMDKEQHLGVWVFQFGDEGEDLCADYECDGDVDAFDRTEFLTTWTSNQGSDIGPAPAH